MTARGERGFALAVAVFALALIGALVGTAFAVAWLETRAARNGWHAAQALGAAEAGVGAMLADWDPDTVTDPIWYTRPGAEVPLGGALSYLASTTRLDASLFLVRVEGFRRAPGGEALARREVAVVVELDPTGGPGGTPAARPIASRSWAQVY